MEVLCFEVANSVAPGMLMGCHGASHVDVTHQSQNLLGSSEATQAGTTRHLNQHPQCVSTLKKKTLRTLTITNEQKITAAHVLHKTVITSYNSFIKHIKTTVFVSVGPGAP